MNVRRIAIVAVSAAVVGGCGTEEGGRTSGSGLPTGITSAGSGGNDTGGDDGGTGAGDDTGATVDCEGDEDCPAGQHCGVMSKQCLDPTGCVFDADCDDGFTCDAGTCSIGGECGGFQFEITKVPPNLMILLDRSGSMSGDVPGAGMNRWEVSREAIDTVTSTFDAEIRFGLATYSSCLAGGCSAGSVVVPVADGNAMAIQGFLDTTAGEGSNSGMSLNGNGLIQYLCDSGDPETSTGKSLNALVGEPSLLDPTRTNAVLLMTDGGESGECTAGSVNGPGGASNLFAQNPSVQTFAVGMGGANLAELEAIAIAGGTTQPYFADQPADLQMVLGEIAAAVASCVFALDEIPPDPNQIYVFFDLDPAGVPVDPTNGWTYDEATNTITFHGTSCDQIRNGTIVDIDIVYGCDMPPVG